MPIIIKSLALKNKNDLLDGEGPFYLNFRKKLGNYQDLNNDLEDYKEYTLLDDTSEYNMKLELNKSNNELAKKYKYTYSINFDLYIDSLPQNTSYAYNKETELFNYGNKPVILYDGRTSELIIKTQTFKKDLKIMETVYKTKNFKYQKWLKFVINYEDFKIDIFIDDKLVGSKDNVPPFFNDDTITIGENNGIHGSIKDIYYYDKIKPSNNLEFLYSEMKK